MDKNIGAGKIDPKLLELLVCPLKKNVLILSPDGKELISEKASLAYPIRNGVPIMLVSEARKIEDQVDNSLNSDTI